MTRRGGKRCRVSETQQTSHAPPSCDGFTKQLKQTGQCSVCVLNSFQAENRAGHRRARHWSKFLSRADRVRLMWRSQPPPPRSHSEGRVACGGRGAGRPSLVGADRAFLVPFARRSSRRRFVWEERKQSVTDGFQPTDKLQGLITAGVNEA